MAHPQISVVALNDFFHPLSLLYYIFACDTGNKHPLAVITNGLSRADQGAVRALMAQFGVDGGFSSLLLHDNCLRGADTFAFCASDAGPCFNASAVNRKLTGESLENPEGADLVMKNFRFVAKCHND